MLGVAMKNFLIGTDEPAVVPPLQDVPTELCCSAGTKTLKSPCASW